LDCCTRLTFENMMEIYRSGYTRIPIFEGKRSNIIGILYSKDLILIDPDDEVEVKAVLAFHGMHHARFVPDNISLHEVMSLFKHSYTHLMIAVANKSDCHVATGVITLEDVIEEMLNDEIVDESDRFRDNTHRQRLHHRADRPDVTAFLKLFNHKLRHNHLTKEETAAVCSYLKAMLPEFASFTGNALSNLVRKSEVIEIEEAAVIPQDFDASPPNETPKAPETQKRIVYKQGVKSNRFTLILQGHLQIEAGTERFTSHVGPWGFLGVMALKQLSYIPDFDAVATNSCRILQISRDDYNSALKRKSVSNGVSGWPEAILM